MHQAILKERENCGEDTNVAIRASSCYGTLPIRFKRVGPEQFIHETAADEGFWLLPLVYLRQLASYLGALRDFRALFRRLAPLSVTRTKMSFQRGLVHIPRMRRNTTYDLGRLATGTERGIAYECSSGS